MKDITLGRYYPGSSFVHNLDPRTKILFTIIYMVIIFLVDRLWLFLPVAMFIFLAVMCAQMPLKYMLQSLKPLRWILLMMFIINLFFIKTGRVLVSVGILTVTDESVTRAFIMMIRLVLLVCGTSLMTLTTTPIALTDGLEKLLSPLKRIRFPVHEMSMMMTIALRFIPTLLDETDRIMKAQMARGADFETGNVFARAKAMVPVIIPLFVSAFRRADELAFAMESRCYHGGEGRTRMRIMKFQRSDFVAFICIVLIGVVVIALKSAPM